MKKVLAIISALFLATSSVAYAGGYGGFHHGAPHGHFRGGFPIGPAIGLGLIGAGIAAGTTYECWRMVQTFDDYGRPYYVRQWVC